MYELPPSSDGVLIYALPSSSDGGADPTRKASAEKKKMHNSLVFQLKLFGAKAAFLHFGSSHQPTSQPPAEAGANS